MGFSGKPSKGCAPCREKRTKCDLRQPSCTQCKRKQRQCVGYRNELDIIFRNETIPVTRKAERRAREKSAQSEQRHACRALTAQPSRQAALGDEATMHFLANWNERFFSADCLYSGGGFDYILPVLQRDLDTGGPVPEIIKASGLAALGNIRAAPELLTKARHTQTEAIGLLNRQLQDPRTQTSDSSILAIIMLAIFENIICDSPSTAKTMGYHLTGASALIEMRGPSRFNDSISHAIFSRIRGFILGKCLQTRDPLPEFILPFLYDESMAQRDFEPTFWRLIARLCHVRAHHKVQGFVDLTMAQEAQLLMAEFEAWQPSFPEWATGERPTFRGDLRYSNEDATHRFVWLASAWTNKQIARILAAELLIDWARTELLQSSGLPESRLYNDAVHKQILLCEELQASTEYFLDTFKEFQSNAKMLGGYSLLWPFYVLSTAVTSTPHTMIWIAKQAQRVAEEFGIPQAKAMSDFSWTVIRSSPFPIVTTAG